CTRIGVGSLATAGEYFDYW
nr:immunoglobulin heavy chain junction region [Macaca mulatta]MOX61210.1 immunoglobulin heavy chain junction region [Macaca mulatta]MOX62855.1 immunoglobulin heavy chain junction region [Macaca mulatta]MOX65729.1 immunoglobulin heavy chain junction region [Macaca mulatta]MOX67191.1 immunoglobulin heavy chain junction region [Macaca mulatta]